VNNAFACGEMAVRAAVEGKSGYMVKIVRLPQADGSIKWGTDLQPLADIANVEHMIPREWINEDGFLPNQQFIDYALPLIQGEAFPPSEMGLPKFVQLQKTMLEKKLAPYG
jgi:6-phosphofructokinase 1